MPKELIGWIINKSNATSQEILDYSKIIEDEIGRKLEKEVQLIGFEEL